MQWLIDLILNAVRAGVKQTTADGADINRTFFAAGGEPEIDRGAYIDLYGNEHPDHPGVAALFGEGDIGINTISPLFTFSIASADGSGQVGFYHDNTNAYFKTTTGTIVLLTDKAVDTNTLVDIKGKGTGRGFLRIFDQDNKENLSQTIFGGVGFITVDGINPVRLNFQSTADIPIVLFESATEGETEQLQISGWHTGDASMRTLSQGISPDAHDTALWSGVAHYVFTGNVRVTGAVISGTLTHSAVGPTDNLDVSGVNTVFVDCSANNVTIGAFVGGVNGQVLHVVRLCATGFSATLEHNEGTGNQNIFLHAGADEVLTGEYGGWTLVCNGSNWYDISHAKHV